MQRLHAQQARSRRSRRDGPLQSAQSLLGIYAAQLRAVSSAGASTSDASFPDLAGPRNAFVPGQEAETRRQLFNRISPVYDEVSRWPSTILAPRHGHAWNVLHGRRSAGSLMILGTRFKTARMRTYVRFAIHAAQ